MHEQFSRFVERLAELSEHNPEIEKFYADWRQFLKRERHNSMVNSAVLNNIDEVVFTIDAETRSITACNAAVRKVFGYEPHEVIGRSTAFIHLDTQHFNRFGRDSEAELNKGNSYFTEFPLRRRNGERFEAEITVLPVRGDKNWLGGVVSKIKDVSFFKSQENLRRRNTNRLRLITEQLPTILWTTDRELTITSLMGREVYKLREDKRPLLHHRIEEIFTSREDHDVLHSHQQALNGERSSYEVLYQGFVYKAYVEPMYDENEEINGVIGVAYDITEQNRLQANYAERVKELQLLSTFSELNIKYGFDTEKLMQKLVGEMPKGFRWPDLSSVKLQLQQQEFTSNDFSESEHLLSEKIQVYGEDYGLLTVYVDSAAFSAGASAFQDEERVLLKNIAERIGRIIEHKLKNEKLNEQTRQLEAIIENASDLIVVLDDEGRYVQLNSANERITGYTQDELLGMYATEVLDEESRQRFQGLWDDFQKQGEASGELNVEHRNGAVHTVEYTAVAQILPNKNLVLGRDITERKKYEDDLERNLREREVLIQEIHHRVKNNLQIIISMLNLQNAGIRDDVSRRSLDEAKRRIYSIALAYEKLHFSKNLELVQMQAYFYDLIGELSDDILGNISIELDTEPLFFNINTAVLSGIIVNELIMNSVKHAFTQGMAGTVELILRKEGDGEILLAVQDNGKGIGLDINELPPHSLGMRLVDTLAHQLDGNVTFEDKAGTAVSVRLPASAAIEEEAL